jgi:hypothetical protein
MVNKGDSGVWRRIRLYLFGFIIGLIVVYFIYGNKDLKKLTPGLLKLNQLAAQPIHFSDTANCEMKCENVDSLEVRDAMTDGKVDSKKSNDFNVRYPMYNFAGHTRKGRFLHIICIEVDSITRIVMVHDSALKDTCRCH